MERVLITGIGGFIGRRLALALNAIGYDVSGISRSRIKLRNIQVYKADVLDKVALNDICKDKDIFIHLAAVTEYKKIQDSLIDNFEVGLLGTFNVLKAFTLSNSKHFIYPSSGKVYGKPFYLPYDENHKTNPETPLGKTKKICEDMVAYFSTLSDKSFSILRIFNVYGPGQKESFLIPTILSRVNESKIVLGDIRSKRDYIYIQDVVQSFITVIKNYRKGLNIYNVGSGVNHSAGDIVNLLGNLMNKNFNIKIDKSRLRKNESFDEGASVAKLKKLGWEPKYSLKDGLIEILNTRRVS